MNKGNNPHIHHANMGDNRRHEVCCEDGEYNKHTGHSIADFKKRFYVSLAFTVPILILSPVIQHLFGFFVAFPGDKFVLLAISTLVFFYGGWPFLIGAKNEIKNRTIGMMTLISLAINVAYFYGAAVVLGFPGEIFFWELATLIDIMLLGHWIEMRSVMGASMALEKLSALIPDSAHIIKEERAVEIKTIEFQDGNTILVKPGERIPTDGFVVGGESFVNESMLTGEAKPISKKLGNTVIGGSVNEDGSLQIRVEGIGEKSYLSKVIGLVRQAQASKSRTQALADKAAFYLTFIAIFAGIVTFFIWFIISGNIAFAIERMATVLVIACPHALGLAIPLVVAISTTLSAQNGLLVRNRAGFENAGKISTVVFDKTGTLTEGNFGVKNIYSVAGYDENELLRLLAGLEQNSEHPIAKAILREAKARNITIPQVNAFKAVKGRGIEGMIEGRKMVVASPGYAEDFNIKIHEELRNLEGTVIFLIVSYRENNILAGAVNLADIVRKESFEAVKKLKQQGIKVWMLTGDNETSAKSVSDALEIDGYFAGVLPDQKQEKVKELQQEGQFVAMVGDGINDAPALAQADVGIAIGSGTDVAAETADVILVNSNPEDVPLLISFGKATYGKMVQNLIWATGYNIFAIPLAAGILAGRGILLSPALGAVLMSLSTVMVAINAKSLKIKR
ncbi:MAG: copper-translocating P-type ATPase [Candidatus Pacebacteria bacterium]|nr:copper-translocating P-type ATPase [Candidatus Paceibacterota bacterium]